MSSKTDESRRTDIDPREAEIERLQAVLDRAGQEMLEARDALIGAEAELGVARARVREVEFQLHVSSSEVEELRKRVLQLAGAEETQPERQNGMSKRLSPLLGRTPKHNR